MNPNNPVTDDEIEQILIGLDSLTEGEYRAERELGSRVSGDWRIDIWTDAGVNRYPLADGMGQAEAEVLADLPGQARRLIAEIHRRGRLPAPGEPSAFPTGAWICGPCNLEIRDSADAILTCGNCGNRYDSTTGAIA